MRVRTLALLGAMGAALAGCSGTDLVSPPERPALGLNTSRTVYVEAVTYTTFGRLSPESGGFVRGKAHPVSGTGYLLLGDVEADGNDEQYFTEPAGYVDSQLDAFPYSPGCSFWRWVIDNSTTATATTIYWDDYPNADTFRAEFVC